MAPVSVRALRHTILHRNRLFSFTGVFLLGVILYISVTIPTLRTVVTPLEVDTVQDQREALAVLSASNTLIILCLIGVLFLQVRFFPFLLICCHAESFLSNL